MVRLLIVIGVLIAFSMPPPAAATPPPVEAYGKLPALELVSLSPSGERYAFVADDGQARRLFIATTDNKPIQIVNIGAVKVRSLEWAGDNYLIVYLSMTVNIGPDWKVSKQELWTAGVINLQTHKEMVVFNGHDNVNKAVFGIYGTEKINGRWYGYFGGESLEFDYGSSTDMHCTNTYTIGDTMTSNTDLYRVDLETGDLKMVAKGDDDSDGWLVGPNGEIVARSLYNERTGDWRVLTGARAGRELKSGSSKLGGVELMGLGRAEDSLLVRRAGDDGAIIEDLPLDGGGAKTVLDGESTDSLIVDRSTGRWIGATSDGDAPTYSLYSPDLDAKVRGAMKAFPGYVVHLNSWSDDFNRMIVFTDGGDDSGTYWIVDIAKKSAAELGAAYPTIGAASVGPVRMVDWKAADGLALRGVLTLPPGRAPKDLPLVVMPHGGPQVRDYPVFDWWAQVFASRGYAVFQPNFRGSDGYGVKLRDAGFGEWGRKMQTDVSDGIAELARFGIVDPKRACIVGWSYGGYAALAGVTIQHGLYRCAVSMAGVADLSSMLQYVGDEAGNVSASMRYWKKFLGVTLDWGNQVNPISPVKHAAHADAPILLIHGKDDTVVPIAQSQAMEHALKAADKPVEFVTLPNADHGLLHEDTRLAMAKASLDFVLKYNPPDPEPASPPIKQADAAAH